MLPTLTDLAGIEERPEKALDGKSLKPLLLGSGEQWKSRNLVSYWKDKIGVRGPRFRLGYKGGLFDMKKDPGQRTDVSQKFPKVKRVLEKKADHFEKSVLPELGEDDRPFQIGHPGVSWTQVPARDAIPHGGIKRSNKFPTAVIFSTGTERRISYHGRSRSDRPESMTSEMWYACPKRDLGAELELSFRGETLGAKVVRAVDPPLLTGFDRKPRVEGLRFFEPMNLGRMRLSRERANFVCRPKRYRVSRPWNSAF